MTVKENASARLCACHGAKLVASIFEYDGIPLWVCQSIHSQITSISDGGTKTSFRLPIEVVNDKGRYHSHLLVGLR